MRTSAALDGNLLADAEKCTSIKERTALLNADLRALVELEAHAGWHGSGTPKPDSRHRRDAVLANRDFGGYFDLGQSYPCR